MKTKVSKKIIEGFFWGLLAFGMLFVFLFLATHTRPAHGEDYWGYEPGAYSDDGPEYFSDVQDKPDLIIYPNRYRGRTRDRRPEYFSDIQEKPDLIIYPGRGRFSLH